MQEHPTIRVVPVSATVCVDLRVLHAISNELTRRAYAIHTEYYADDVVDV